MIGKDVIMANPSQQQQATPAAEPRRRYRCKVNVAIPNPAFVDETKTPHLTRGIYVPPGTTLELTATEAAVLEKQNAVALIVE